MDTQGQQSYYPAFPQQSIVGSLSEVARLLSKGTEVSEEFIFMSALTCFGAMVSGVLKVNIGYTSDTRLYTLLLGESYAAKKSTAMTKTIDFFKRIAPIEDWGTMSGVGSAEGLARGLEDHSRTLLFYDELQSFIEKTKVQASVLLAMVASLFERNDYQSVTKKKAIDLTGVRLSLLACCTTKTYEQVWTPDAIAIGLPNRLFLVYADAKPKVAWPEAVDKDECDRLTKRISNQIRLAAREFDITSEAKIEWERWYKNLPKSEHVKRLDTIGVRLMPILALTMDKEIVDEEVVKHVMAVMDYELRLRSLTDPIDADTLMAKVEERIRRVLKNRGPLSKREIRQATHADRSGSWAFKTALQNLIESKDISVKKIGRKEVYEYSAIAPEHDLPVTSGQEQVTVPETDEIEITEVDAA
jgi:hypothetical protein